MKKQLKRAVLSGLSAFAAVACHSGEVLVESWRSAYSSADTFIFNGMITGSAYVWVGTDGTVFDGDDWAEWQSFDGTEANGINQTGDCFSMANNSNQKGRLRVVSGSYSFPKFIIGSEGGQAWYEQTGGRLTTSGDFRIASDGTGATQGHAALAGGSVSVGGVVAIGTEPGMTGTLSVSNATLSSSGNIYVGRMGVGTGTLTIEEGAKIRSGTADISIASYGGDGTLVMNGGELYAKYWFCTGRNGNGAAKITVNGGRISTACDFASDGTATERAYNTGNGMLDLSSASGATTVFVQTGGRVHAAGSANGDDKYIAMSVGNNASASAEVDVTGGEMDLDGHLEVPRLGTGKFALGGGSLDVSDEVHIGAGGSSTGTMTVTGGVAKIHSFVQVGRGTGSTATLDIKGGETTVSKYIAVGFGASSTGTLSVSGGKLVMKGSTDIGFILGDSASAASSVMNVTGGEVFANADSYVGWNSPGTLNISGTGYVSVGDASAHKWLKMNNYDAVTGTSRINLDGGVLDVCHVKVERAAGAGIVNFNGGTLRGYANNSYANGNLFGESAQLSVNVKAGGATIEVPAGVSVAVGEPLLADAESAGGGFTKTGYGTLTLAQGNTYSGATRLVAGTLSLPENAFGETGGVANSPVGALELCGGALSGSACEWPSVTVSGGSYDFASLPLASDGRYVLEGGAISVVPDGTYSAAPSTNITVRGGVFVVDVSGIEVAAGETRVTFSNVTFDGVAVSDAVRFSGKEFEWSISANGDGSYTAVALSAATANKWIGGASGYWNDAANWRFGVPKATQTVVFDAPATVFLEGSCTVQTLQVDSTVRFESAEASSIHPAMHFASAGGSGTMQLAHVGLSPSASEATVADTLTLEYVKMNADNSSDSWIGGASDTINIRARITGDGYVRLYSNTRLYGDNSSFTGKVKKDEGDVRFMTPQSGFPNAAQFDLTGTLWIWFASGTISFGGDVTMTTWGEDYPRTATARGINVPEGVSDVVISLGGGDGDVVMERGWRKVNQWNYGPCDDYAVYIGTSSGWVQGSENVTIRKTGTGSMKLAMESAYRLDVAGGLVTLPETSQAIVSVAAGAGVSGGGAVASLTFEPGAYVRQSLTRTEILDENNAGTGEYSYSCAALTCGAAVDVTGVKVDLVDGFGYLAAATSDDTTQFVVLSASAVGGSPEMFAETPMGTKGWVWAAKSAASSLVVRPYEVAKGFAIIVL